MLCANSQTRLRVTAGLGLLALGLGVGCAPTEQAPFSAQVQTTSPASTLVFSSAPVRNWHASNPGEPGVGLIAADRYEFSRNDARLTPQTATPGRTPRAILAMAAALNPLTQACSPGIFACFTIGNRCTKGCADSA